MEKINKFLTIQDSLTIREANASFRGTIIIGEKTETSSRTMDKGAHPIYRAVHMSTERVWKVAK